MTFTDDQIEELIAEARNITVGPRYVGTPWPAATTSEVEAYVKGVNREGDLIQRLAAALDQVKAERDEARAGVNEKIRVLSVEPAWIEAQRKQGWPDMHPEDFCHKCGHRNPVWCAPAEEWRTATAMWAAETGREGICCPACFADMYEEATGGGPVWIMTPWRGSWAAHAAENNDREEKP